MSAPVHAHDVRSGLAGLGRHAPDVMGALNTLHRQATGDGVLSGRTKEIIAVAIAVATGCEGCAAFHLDAAARLGATRSEVSEALGVAVLMAGGPGSVHATSLVDKLEELPDA